VQHMVPCRPPFRARRSATAWWVGIAGHLALLAVVVSMAWLREAPLFWRNAGGWPEWFRDTVRLSFWPLLSAQTVGLVVSSGWGVLLPDQSRRHLILRLGVLMLLWMAWTGMLGFVLANNLINFLEGRPIHDGH